ncbi:kinase-like protein [Lipomyces oligophaga]|uniref:kinase-like protein n=1 Tax=Lipomyces oligophaga TaxID=45792 RepID=UPI0034CFAAF6
MFADPRSAPSESIAVIDDSIDINSNYDDAEGYYRTVIGQVFDERYHIQASLGKGVFSTVVRAVDTATNEPVAIKIIRNNSVMYKAGMKEISILQLLNRTDPDDMCHVIRLVRSFQYRGHLCLVFEGMSCDMRTVIKTRMTIAEIRDLAHQLFLALAHLENNHVLHADLKPDNIFLNKAHTSLKLGDLGSASDISDNEITPYLASRFYRAPEIIVGLPYSYAVDIWSAACTLAELYTGRVLFPGSTNNNMLKLIMQLRGKLPHKLLRKGLFTNSHFDEKLEFQSRESNKLTGKITTKSITFPNGTNTIRDLRSALLSSASPIAISPPPPPPAFVDLLDKMLNLNPEKRISAQAALNHPFFN